MENLGGNWVWREFSPSVAPSARPHFWRESFTRIFAVYVGQSSNVFRRKSRRSKLLMSCIRCAEAPLCEAQSFSQRKRTEARIQMRTRFCEAILRERIRKTSANFFSPEFVFRRAGGCGRNARRIFWRGAEIQNPKLPLLCL